MAKPKIYTWGYSGSRPEYLTHYLDTLNAVLVDVRYKPTSRDPRWRPGALVDLVGITRHYHLKELGNVNYKTGGPVELADPETALRILQPVLAKRSIILMCACKEWEGCHRRNAAEFLADRLGAKVVHLPGKPVDYRPPFEQLELFP